MKLYVYHKDGTKVRNIAGSEIFAAAMTYNQKRMGEEVLTATFKSPVPIEFAIGDYVVFHNTHYSMQVLPTVKKKSSNGSVGNAYTYENAKFCSPSDELTRCMFLDYVPSDNGGYYSGTADVNFFAEDVKALGDRIKCNLDRIYTTDKWTVTYKDITAGKKNIPITINNNTCWDALSQVKEQFKLNFTIRGREIVIGKETIDLVDYTDMIDESSFSYGKGNGLVNIEKTTDESQLVVTRLRAYGNTTNMPTRYYSNIDVKCFMPAIQGPSTYNPYKPEYILSSENDNIMAQLRGLKEFEAILTPDIYNFINDYIEGKTAKAYVYTKSFLPSHFSAVDTVSSCGMISMSLDKDGTDAHECAVVSKWWCEKNDKSLIERSGNITIIVVDSNEILRSYWTNNIYITAGADKDKWPYNLRTASSSVLPNNMSINRLMLPGFPTKSLAEKHPEEEWAVLSNEQYDPYIDSPDVDTLGVREATVIFDGSDELDDIYPTISNLEANVVSATGFEDTGIFGTDKANSTIKDFKIVVAGLDFNIKDYLVSGSTPTISMKTGYCAGREFQISQCKDNGNGSYTLSCKRQNDSSLDLYFPYSDYPVSAGDKFALTGISLPDQYIAAASEKLYTAAIDYLKKNCVVKYKYSLELDSIFLQRQHDYATRIGEDSLVDTICAGVNILFHDDDLDIDVSMPIDTVEIKLGDGLIPKYKVTLADEPTVGSLKRVQQKVEAVAENAITELFALNFIDDGTYVGTYNPASKGMTIDMSRSTTGNKTMIKAYDSSGNYIKSVDIADVLKLVSIGTETVQKTDENGNPLYLDADGNETTTETDVPANEQVHKFETTFSTPLVGSGYINILKQE